MSKRKPPKNLRPYATPSGKKARLVEMTEPHTVRVLEDGQGNLGVPHLIPGPDCWFVRADELRKWRASQTTSGDKP